MSLFLTRRKMQKAHNLFNCRSALELPKDIIFAWRGAHEVRLNPCEVRLKWTSENEENSEKLKFFFWVEGTFGDYIWSVYILKVQYSMDNQ